MKPFMKIISVIAAAALTACASPAPDGGLGDVQRLSAGKTAGVVAALAVSPTAETRQSIDALLAQPLTEAAAVRIALLNNPGLHQALATLGVNDAERAQMGRLPNPTLILGRLTQGDTVEIERVLKFDILGLLTLPWRTQRANQQTELAKLQAAQSVVKLAADTRKAWVHAVASQQSARYQRDVKEAAEAGAELARRLASAGNWSRLSQARQQAFLVDATAQLARAEQTALSRREDLTRLLGLWGAQAAYQLPQRLPDLPESAQEITDVEAKAIAQRLDVQSAVREAAFVAEAQGFEKVTGFVNALDVSVTHNTITDNASGASEIKRGLGVELPLPLFDWGQARNARAKNLYLQSVARVQEVGVRARSEARETYHGYRTAYDLARYYRDEVVPLHKFIADEMLMRYSGMLSSLFDVLADTRANADAVKASLEAQRDFWLADTDLQTTLSGTSP